MRIVITGSSSGIGRALTERLLSHGHSVWGLARSDQSEFETKYPNAFFSKRCDVAEWAQVDEAAQSICAKWPKIDGLVTCAGVQGAIGRTTTIDPLQWSATVRANLDGTFYAVRAFREALRRASPRAKIVCFSGGGSTKPRPNFSAYGASKTAVVRLVETIAEEEQGTPIDINAVAPGAINTRLTDELIALGPDVVGESEYKSALRQKESGGASLARALDLVEWLLSPVSDGVSGLLLSAQWDRWVELSGKGQSLRESETYVLRRTLPSIEPKIG
jgi:NAD(P)-dependent dehydrogenase (short-subunit alcohol dehydrogenase family)